MINSLLGEREQSSRSFAGDVPGRTKPRGLDSDLVAGLGSGLDSPSAVRNEDCAVSLSVAFFCPLYNHIYNY